MQLVGIQIYNLNIARIKNNTKNNNNVIIVPLAVPLGSSLSLSHSVSETRSLVTQGAQRYFKTEAIYGHRPQKGAGHQNGLTAVP